MRKHMFDYLVHITQQLSYYLSEVDPIGSRPRKQQPAVIKLSLSFGFSFSIYTWFFFSEQQGSLVARHMCIYSMFRESLFSWANLITFYRLVDMFSTHFWVGFPPTGKWRLGNVPLRGCRSWCFKNRPLFTGCHCQQGVWKEKVWVWDIKVI